MSIVARRSVFSAAPKRTRLSPLDVGKIVHQGAGRVPDPIEWTLSDRYMGKGMLYPRQGTMLKVMFLRDDMFCADEETQILTRRGWKHYWEVIEGEDVLTLRQDGAAEWAPAERVNVFPVTDEPLVLMEGEGHSSLTTPNHRWLVERLYQKRTGYQRETEFIETQDLRKTDRIACAAPVLNLPTESPWTDAFVELVAWYWTEGTAIVGNRGGVKIGQSTKANPTYVERIRKCLTDLFGPPSDTLRATDSPSWREDPAPGEMVYFRLNSAASVDLRWIASGAEKVIRPEFLDSLTQGQLDLYIETVIDADGWRKEGKHETARKITQASRERLESFQMACSLAGIRTVLREDPIRTGQWTGNPRWSLTLHGERRRYFSPQPRPANERRDHFKIEQVLHTGHVWCPTTPNGTWLARRDGKVYFTGNTDYDLDVIGEWEETFMRTGNEGISPGIMDRIKTNKAKGRKWFRETDAAIGRRGGKGHIGAIAGALVTWHFMNVPGGPQAYYGIDPNKRLASIVFAGKKEQAVAYQWRDLTQAITTAPCFQPYISRDQAERLTLFTPNDLLKLQQMELDGVKTEKDIASIEIVPSGNTPMAGRGPAAYSLFFDEMAHIVKSGAGSDAGQIYESSSPALDQFGVDGFIYAGSSPWQMQGKFYENAQLAIEMEDGQPVYPERLLLQLPSWGPYEDWKYAHQIGLAPSRKTYIDVKVDGKTVVQEKEIVGRTFPAVRFPIQTFDDEMKKLERANPETFRVERRCLDPDTRVLRADLRWVRIDSLRVGDSLVSLDEEGEVNESTGRRGERKLRVATVEAKADSFDLAYRIEFTDGTSVVCSGRHRWLSSSAGSSSNLRWRSIEPQSTMGPRSVLKPGDTIRAVTEPWGEDDSFDAGWLSGMYDGEGCVVSRTRNRTEFRIDLTQKYGPVYDRAFRLLDERGFFPRHAGWHRDGGDHIGTIRVTGLSDCLRLLGQLRPMRLLANGNPGMWEGRALGHHRGARLFKTVERVVALEEQRLVDIQTSTGTFIAEGLVSHNSQWAASLSAYLNMKKVEVAFKAERRMTVNGPLSRFYAAHGDPAKVNDNFGFAIGHTEPGDESTNGLPRVVFDVIKSWRTEDFDVDQDGVRQIDYNLVQTQIERYIAAFKPDVLTFDQFNSVMMIGNLKNYVYTNEFPKTISVSERTATAGSNWREAEVFKAALNMNLIEFPSTDAEGNHSRDIELLELELTFLEEKNGKVDHPTSGPVQSKDIADSVMAVTYHLIGEQMTMYLKRLGEAHLGAGVQPGTFGLPGNDPAGTPTSQADPARQMSDLMSGGRTMADAGAGRARGMRRR